MIIKVKAKPKASKEYVKELSENFYEVAVKEVPQKGKANERIIELLSEHFNLPKTKIKLISGSASKIKVFELKD
mgnify:CR=1 FL=1